MKLMIASDIHGSAFYCKELLKAFENEHADKILLLGDILYHGPRNDLPKDYAPKEVIAMLNGIKEYIICVRGNCDTEVDQMVLEFPVLGEQALLYVDGTEMLAVHGHKPFPSVKAGTFVLSGHTHVPKLEEASGVTYMNPGSVSIPKENSHHGYMVFENKKFLWKDFDGNIKNEYSVK
jgi:putative phosphoesterase